MKWHHENVDVACLSADEVRKPPADPQDKLDLLKIVLNTKRKYQEHFWKSPEILDSSQKSHLWWAARILIKEDSAKKSIYLDLWLNSYNCLKCSVNSNEFE